MNHVFNLKDNFTNESKNNYQGTKEFFNELWVHNQSILTYKIKSNLYFLNALYKKTHLTIQYQRAIPPIQPSTFHHRSLHDKCTSYQTPHFIPIYIYLSSSFRVIVFDSRLTHGLCIIFCVYLVVREVYLEIKNLIHTQVSNSINCRHMGCLN